MTTAKIHFAPVAQWLAAATLLTVSPSLVAQADSAASFQTTLQEIDENGNQLAEWAEVANAYSAEIDRVGWDREQIMTSFNQDQDRGLNKKEFDIFVDSLQREQQLNQNQQVSQAAASQQTATRANQPVYGIGEDDFARLDTDGDQHIGWRELQSGYREPLSAAGWNREQVLAAYDQNRDTALDESEYVLFVTDLQLATSASELPVATAQQSQQQSAGQGLREQSISITAGEPVSTSDRQADGAEASSRPRAQAQSAAADTTGSGAGSGVTASSDPAGAVVLGSSERVGVDQISGKDLYSSAGEKIGTVKDVVRSSNGSETVLVVRRGGFWGIGGKDVAVGADEVRLQQNRLVWKPASDGRSADELPAYDDASFESFVSLR